MSHYDFAYHSQDTRSANLASKCNFWKGTLAVYPVSLFFSIRNHKKKKKKNVFMHNSSDMNHVSEHMERDSILSAFTNEIGKQSGVAILFPIVCLPVLCLKTSLTFKCLIEHLLADFSYSRPLDTYLWKQMMKMNRNITYKWCNIAKKHLLFTKRKCHKFSWLFTASRCSPRRRSICACRIACKVLVSIGL